MLVVCILTVFLTVLPFLDSVGEVPLKPGFWMPRPLLAFAGLGFLRLDRNGLRVIEPVVDPLEDKLVDSVTMLPLVPEYEYGFPLASVTDTLPPVNPSQINNIVSITVMMKS